MREGDSLAPADRPAVPGQRGPTPSPSGAPHDRPSRCPRPHRLVHPTARGPQGRHGARHPGAGRHGHDRGGRRPDRPAARRRAGALLRHRAPAHRALGDPAQLPGRPGPRHPVRHRRRRDPAGAPRPTSPSAARRSGPDRRLPPRRWTGGVRRVRGAAGGLLRLVEANAVPARGRRRHRGLQHGLPGPGAPADHRPGRAPAGRERGAVRPRRQARGRRPRGRPARPRRAVDRAGRRRRARRRPDLLGGPPAGPDRPLGAAVARGHGPGRPHGGAGRRATATSSAAWPRP